MENVRDKSMLGRMVREGICKKEILGLTLNDEGELAL